MGVTVAFAGNPNVGKSTVFNALTGLRQHTGNWTGKTVEPARGRWSLAGTAYEAVDLPGIYSLEGGTPEERVAAAWLGDHAPRVLVAVLDATALERSLTLALELRALHPRLVICLNLMDEAERLSRVLDPDALQRALAAPVVPTRADRPKSYEVLGRTVALTAQAPAQTPEAAPPPRPVDREALQEAAAALAETVLRARGKPRRDWDRLVLGRWTALPLALGLLFALFALTVWGANLPSALLERLLGRLGAGLEALLTPLPPTLRSLLVDGIYGTAAQVTAVMLPPMAIFFPLFSLLEDLGLLPRLALLLDRPFAACGTCGRQGLCMCMGCGCNAVGITGCRIIPGPRSRLAAILTNAMTPCNGRFPTLILLAGLVLGRGGGLSVPATAGVLTACAALSVGVTLLTTAILRRTLLRGEEGGLVLELPPFRRPQVGRLLVRALLDRTLRVLGRAVTVAAPAGAILWALARLRLGEAPLLTALAQGLDPLASALGLTGTLLLAFLLSFPANELLLPLALLIAGAGNGGGLGDPALLFTARTALCAGVFTLFHWPCSTALLTVRRETGSRKWTALAAALPTAVGVLLCAGTNLVWTLLS